VDTPYRTCCGDGLSVGFISFLEYITAWIQRVCSLKHVAVLGIRTVVQVAHSDTGCLNVVQRDWRYYNKRCLQSLSCCDLASKNCKNTSVYFLLVSLCVFNSAKPTKQIVVFNLTFVRDVDTSSFAIGKQEQPPLCVLLDVIDE
jgi:hypothetical protein